MVRRDNPARDAVAARYDQAAGYYDRVHGDPVARARFAIVEAPMLRAARGAARVLELGCGTGRLLSQVADGGADAPVCVGIDIARAMLARARAPVRHVAAADAHCLPFAEHSFDAILAGKGVFRYLRAADAFAECARVLAPGGSLAVHQYAARTWSLRGLQQRVRGVSSDARRAHTERSGIWEVRDRRDMIEPARRAGLEVVEARFWRSIRVPPYALEVPAWLPGSWWSHCVFVYCRHGRHGRRGRRGRRR